MSKMGPLQRRRAHSGFYYGTHSSSRLRSYFGVVMRMNVYATDCRRKRARRKLTPRPLRKPCNAGRVPCPPFQDVQLDIESIYDPVLDRWVPYSELPILDVRKFQSDELPHHKLR
jgi:hypothetical protein